MTGMNNHTRTRTGLACMLALLFAFIFSSGSVVYARQAPSTAILPIIQKFTVNSAQYDSVDKQCSYELVSLDTDSPMPEGSVSGRYHFTLDGSGQQKLSVTYTHGGVYQYRLRQATADADRYHYDRHIYTIYVYVENGQNGALTTQVIAENEQKEKCESISFENSYTGKNSPGTQTTENQNPSGGRGHVKTGDHATIAVWIWMLLIVAAGIAMHFVKREKM